MGACLHYNTDTEDDTASPIPKQVFLDSIISSPFHCFPSPFPPQKPQTKQQQNKNKKKPTGFSI